MSLPPINIQDNFQSLLAPSFDLATDSSGSDGTLTVKMPEEDLIEIETVMYPTYKPKWIRDYIHHLYQKDDFEVPTYQVPKEMRDNPRHVYLSMLAAAKIKY